MSHSETEYAVALIRRVTQRKTLVMVEHDMRVVFDLADTITVLVYGQVVASGPPAEIRANRAVQEAYLGRSRHDARGSRLARLLWQEPHPAGRQPVGRQGRNR